MVETYLANHCWIMALLWVIVHTSDYYLTLIGARLLRAQTYFVIDGSYELTPQYQDDIDKGSRLSPRFLGWLVFGTFVMLIPSVFGGIKSLPWLYGFYAGLLIVPEMIIHTRHVDNSLVVPTPA